ncbi:MAG: hypothetical protein F6K16_41485, partial [Symploca sp. SIO2B6]|nr:hypothetical protein [Symploca sp. SIO2B6]
FENQENGVAGEKAGNAPAPPVEDDDILEVELLDQHNNASSEFQTLDTLMVYVHLRFKLWPESVKLVVQILTPGDELSISHFSKTFSLTAVHKTQSTQNVRDEPSTVKCKIPELTLREGKYRLSVTATPIDSVERQRSRSRLTSLATFKVKDRPDQDQVMAVTMKKSPGLVYMPVQWFADSKALVQEGLTLEG